MSSQVIFSDTSSDHQTWDTAGGTFLDPNALSLDPADGIQALGIDRSDPLNPVITTIWTWDEDTNQWLEQSTLCNACETVVIGPGVYEQSTVSFANTYATPPSIQAIHGSQAGYVQVSYNSISETEMVITLSDQITQPVSFRVCGSSCAAAAVPQEVEDHQSFDENGVDDPNSLGLTPNDGNEAFGIDRTDPLNPEITSVWAWDETSSRWLEQLHDAVTLGINRTTTVSGATYTAGTNQETVILADASSNAITIDLPAGSPDLYYTIKKIDSSVNIVTVDGNGTQTIDGDLTKDITVQYESIKIVSDGNNWWII